MQLITYLTRGAVSISLTEIGCLHDAIVAAIVGAIVGNRLRWSIAASISPCKHPKMRPILWIGYDRLAYRLTVIVGDSDSCMGLVVYNFASPKTRLLCK